MQLGVHARPLLQQEEDMRTLYDTVTELAAQTIEPMSTAAMDKSERFVWFLS